MTRAISNLVTLSVLFSSFWWSLSKFW